MNRADYEQQLQRIGHFKAAVIHQRNDRWRAECECGYVSATRVSAKEAVNTIEHHRKKALAAARINGRDFPHKAVSTR